MNDRGGPPRSRTLVSLAFIVIAAGLSCGCGRNKVVETYPFKADTRHLDPFAALGEVRARVGPRAHLTKISVDYVRSDGTMDLQATYSPAPRIDYYFQVPLDKAPAGAPPIGAGVGGDKPWAQEIDVKAYEPGQVRSVTGTVSYSYANEGMDLKRDPPTREELLPDIGDPKATVVGLWKIAMQKGANKDAVAKITYDKDGYQFGIENTPIGFRCDLTGKEVLPPTSEALMRRMAGGHSPSPPRRQHR